MAEPVHVDHGFEPVYDGRSRLLVLGSFPSVLSRENAFYYGNPQNRFWKVIATLYDKAVPADEPVSESVEAKRELLLECRIALWDVVASCDVAGSSDTSIRNVVPVDISPIFGACDIERIYCNGATAGRLYRRYLLPSTGREAIVLPSTSPANAAWSLERLIGRWGELGVGRE